MSAASDPAVALILVSHSRQLAEATAALARQMTGEAAPIFCAAGAGDDGMELGTDAMRIASALETADSPAGAVVLMDLGSAILSAEMALDFIAPDLRDRVRLIAAPFVEGAVAAAVAAAGGLPLARVAEEALAALRPKAEQLGAPEASVLAPGRQSAPAPAAESHSFDAILRDPHGLHARPAAQLVLAANRFEADVTVFDHDNGRGPVSARSLTALASLGARRNHRLRVAATGPDARRAAQELVSLILSFTGDEAAPAAPASVASEEGRAIPLSPGVAFGPVFTLQRVAPAIPDAPASDVALELIRLGNALDEVRHDRARSGAGSEIIAVQEVFLQDPQLIGAAERLIREERRNVAAAFAQATEDAAAIYAGLDDPALQARAADLRDAANAVLHRLLGAKDVELPAGPSILLAEDLSPSVAFALIPGQILGVIDRRGGPSSHASILLRELGIPAIGGADALLPLSFDGVAAFDGATGELLLNPSADAAGELEKRHAAHVAMVGRTSIRDGVAALRDGSTVELWANVASRASAVAARNAGAFGIGLLRTEMMFLDRSTPPSETEQVAALKSIFDVFTGRPVTVRTLDAGGDKPVPYMKLAAEANPYLGVRGLRLSLREMPLFETQLRAILTAGCGHDLSILLPMVTEASEVVSARAALERAHADLKQAGVAHAWPAPLGVMIEVPAAALDAAALAGAADFFSIGTNDLTQYALAAERGHPGLSRFASAAHPAVLKLVRSAVSAARARGLHVLACGEAAGDQAVGPLLVGAGVSALSMSAGALAPMAATLAEVTLDELRARAEEAGVLNGGRG